MALDFQSKQAIVDKINAVAQCALSAVVVNNRGVPVGKMDALRRAGRLEKVYMHVVRNTLLRRAVQNTPYNCLQEAFVGPSLIAFAHGHPGAAARLLKEFAKENSSFVIKAAAFEGQLIPAEKIDCLALLPTYEEAIARLMATMKEAAAGKLVRTLAAWRDKLQAEEDK